MDTKTNIHTETITNSTCNYQPTITNRTSTAGAYRQIINTKNRLPTDSRPRNDTVTSLSDIEHPLQRAWVETILQHGPHQLMWTFVFKGSYDDHVLHDSMNFIICRLNRKLSSSKHFDRNEQYLQGFYSAEQTRKGVNRGNLHYHLLTKEYPGIPNDIAVEKMNSLLTDILPRVKHNGRRMLEQSCVDIQLIDNEVGAAAYITKEIAFIESTNGNHVGTIEPRGLLPPALFSNRNRLCG